MVINGKENDFKSVPQKSITIGTAFNTRLMIKVVIVKPLVLKHFKIFTYLSSQKNCNYNFFTSGFLEA